MNKIKAIKQLCLLAEWFIILNCIVIRSNLTNRKATYSDYVLYYHILLCSPNYYYVKEPVVQIREGKTPTIFEEFDPGSGLTLAECLTHASRTDLAD